MSHLCLFSQRDTWPLHLLLSGHNHPLSAEPGASWRQEAAQTPWSRWWASRGATVRLQGLWPGLWRVEVDARRRGAGGGCPARCASVSRAPAERECPCARLQPAVPYVTAHQGLLPEGLWFRPGVIPHPLSPLQGLAVGSGPAEKAPLPFWPLPVPHCSWAAGTHYPPQVPHRPWSSGLTREENWRRLAVVLLFGFPRGMGAPRVPGRTVLFQREQTGLTYRVPALLSVPPGPTLLAFAEQRLSPDDSHAHRLVLRRGTRVGGAVRWGALHVLGTAALEEHRSMNPCPVLDAGSGTVFLFFIAVLGHTPEAVQIATGRNAARLCCVTSHDAGLSWGSARDLTEEAIGPVVQDWATFAVGPGHGVQLRSGRLLVPAYTYRVDRRECFGKICWTSPHSFAFYSDDHGHTWHCGGLVPNLRSGECQLAAVDGGFLYCNARSPLGSRVQALSADEGTSFLPGELVPTLTETARGCQGSILGFPAPVLTRHQDEGRSLATRNTPQPPCLCPGVQEPPRQGTGGTHGGRVPGGPFYQTQLRDNGPEKPGPQPGLGGDRGAWVPMLLVPSTSLPQSHTWLLYSHPAGRRARLHMGIYLSRSPLDPHSWTEPWVIYEGPSGYSDLASFGPVPGAALAFACLFESGARASYEDISFCMFSLREILENVPAGPERPSRRDKPQGRCRPS